ncbi:hypothetical protein [Roseovarius indicus]|uniref:Uncharacterized protein n=1 Tax=Roseovarius indicus TaxID=540747 RepID=A0A0T5PCH0_9RHOB|nr:hypothetical protein [Roseovarius indicus]KRS18953.1 hypothetical protein XM52_04570 [Roseovarius indicus]QEW26115.1 hypothetical protein RIdsm_01909 [Roseovarius indicus]SFD93489.1 hypothetical protein SAMN04488031_103321 [Roseovarius indicus]
MEIANTPGLTTARLQAELAAQWLNLIRFENHHGAPTFSPSMCYYHAMLDPEAGDSARLEACRAMLLCIRRRLPIEDFKGLAKFKEERPKDPYGKAWKTTRLGAELWMIAHLLEIAISGLEEGCR